MAKRKSFELWDEPADAVEERDDRDESEDPTWEPTSGHRATSSSDDDDDDWDDDDAGDGGDDWLDETVDDLESEIQGCDEGDVYRLLGRPGRRGRD